jgi:hypothetical protein
MLSGIFGKWTPKVNDGYVVYLSTGNFGSRSFYRTLEYVDKNWFEEYAKIYYDDRKDYLFGVLKSTSLS